MIQGTTLKVTFAIKDADTALPFDPVDEIQVAIIRPSALTVQTYANGTGQILRMGTGVYRAAIDTSPEPGDWEYEIAVLSPTEGVRYQRRFSVDPKRGP